MADCTSRVAALFVDLNNFTAEILEKIGEIASAEATALALDITACMAQNWDSQEIYIPQRWLTKTDEERRKIFNEFTGANHVELAKKFNKSFNAIYIAIRTEYSRRKDSRGRSREPEILTDLVDHIEKILKKSGKVSQDRLELIAVKIASQLVDRWGGQSIFISRCHPLNIEELLKKVAIQSSCNKSSYRKEPIIMKRSSRAPELLADLVAHTEEVLNKIGNIPSDKAEMLAWEITDRMISHWGGQLLYIPSNVSQKVKDVHLKIYSEFTGNNHADLAMKYQKSVITIYAVIDRIQKQLRDQRQDQRQDGLF